VAELGRDRDRHLTRQIARREDRMLRGRRESRSPWFGLGMYGLVGWSVAVPTLLGLALGVWIDGAAPGPLSWTLMLLFAGLIAGCCTAWYWVAREQRAIGRREGEEEHHGGA
jgi:ATP synthase protein I